MPNKNGLREEIEVIMWDLFESNITEQDENSRCVDQHDYLKIVESAKEKILSLVEKESGESSKPSCADAWISVKDINASDCDGQYWMWGKHSHRPVPGHYNTVHNHWCIAGFEKVDQNPEYVKKIPLPQPPIEAGEGVEDCKGCGEPLLNDQEYCDGCGEPICDNCGRTDNENHTGSFCAKCCETLEEKIMKFCKHWTFSFIYNLPSFSGIIEEYKSHIEGNYVSHSASIIIKEFSHELKQYVESTKKEG